MLLFSEKGRERVRGFINKDKNLLLPITYTYSVILSVQFLFSGCVEYDSFSPG